MTCRNIRFWLLVTIAASALLALGAARAEAVVVNAAPTWPIPSDAPAGPPSIPTMPAAGDTTPPADAIADPITAGASCSGWYLQSNYGDRWPAASNWWEYRCSDQDAQYHNTCTGPACDAFCPTCYWETQDRIDYFVWDGSNAVFYGEAYSDSVVYDGDFSYSSADWWDAPTAQWYLLSAFPLSISKDGTGSGVVSSSPAGINCGDTCFEIADPGSSVTLTATPDASSVFAGWSGDCSGTDVCQVTMDQAHSVSATFEPKRFTLTVSTAGKGSGLVYMTPGGTGCRSCTENFDVGTAVTLTPSADASSTFTGWSGDCSGSGSCQVTMDQARAVTATFLANTPPAASFTVTCTGLTCGFNGGGSNDSDGTIASYAWSFGDGSSGSALTVSHTYAKPGSYTVTLTVTDNAGATATASSAVNPISLSARGYKQTGRNKVDLSWSGPDGTTFDVYRNGGKIATVSVTNYTDTLQTKGTYTYKVCATAVSICSNVASAIF